MKNPLLISYDGWLIIILWSTLTLYLGNFEDEDKIVTKLGLSYVNFWETPE